MNIKASQLAILFAATTVVCGSFAFHFYQRSTGVQFPDPNVLEGERVSVRRDLVPAEVDKDVKSITYLGSSSRSTPALSPPSQQVEMKDYESPSAMLYAMVQNEPSVQEFLAASMRDIIAKHYNKFIVQLGLSKEKGHRLMELILRKQMALSEVEQTALAHGVNPSAPASRNVIDKLRMETSAEMEDLIRQELGGENYAEYNQYNEALPRANTIADLQQRLRETEAPLSQWQQDQLLLVLARTTSKKSYLQRPDAVVSISDEAIAQAATLLSQPQLEALKRMQQEAAEKKNQSAGSYNLFGE